MDCGLTNRDLYRFIREYHQCCLADTLKLLHEDYLFVLLSAHSAGYTPLALQNLLSDVCPTKRGRFKAAEMVVPEADSERLLPSGAACLFSRQRGG